MPATLQVISPHDGSVLCEVPNHGADEVRAAVARAREAQRAWGVLSPKRRAAIMSGVARVLERRAHEIAAAVHSETGKPETEALAGVVVCVDLIGYYRKAAPRLLRRRRVPTGWMMWKSGYVEHEPVGVVGGITPWNYPLILAMDCITTALFAGNAVVLKPSEFTPVTAMLLPEIYREGGVPDGLVQVVTGDGRTGAVLVESGVDKIVFTGSSATGKKVMASASESLTPVMLELGGKDPAIVRADADIERAARGVVFGSFFNAGQTCISIERVYVARPIFEPFSARVAELTKRLRQGTHAEADVGPMITEPQLEIVKRHVEDALARGARALCGGAVSDGGRGFQPTVLVDVETTMAVLREESFGPVLPLIPFDTDDEAIALANDSGYGLFASVWTGDTAEGVRMARRLQAGGVSVNDSLSHYGVAALPMGGVKESGFGRRRGPEGLLEMSQVRTVFIDRLGLRREPWWFPYSDKGVRLIEAVLQWRTFGGVRGAFRAIRRLLRRP